MRLIVSAGLLLGLSLVGCSEAPAPLSETEFLKILAEVNRVGPLNFQQKVWPLLEKKPITYCGPLEQSRVVGMESVLLFKVDETDTGEKLPWFLEGRSASSDLAPLHKVGESVCMTGTIEGFTFREPSYWGRVQIRAVEEQRPSQG